MKRHRETILPPSASKGPSPAAKGRAAATSTQGDNTNTAHALRRKPCLHARLTFYTIVEWTEFSLCLDVDRRAPGQNDTESHEKLAQRIEKDVVSVFIQADTCHYITQLLSTSHNDIFFMLITPGFVSLSKSSTAPWMTSRSLWRGCKRQRRPFLSSTIATRVRRIRRKDQQVCLPFFFCGGTNVVTIYSYCSRRNVCVSLCPVARDGHPVMHVW